MRSTKLALSAALALALGATAAGAEGDGGDSSSQASASASAAEGTPGAEKAPAEGDASGGSAAGEEPDAAPAERAEGDVGTADPGERAAKAAEPEEEASASRSEPSTDASEGLGEEGPESRADASGDAERAERAGRTEDAANADPEARAEASAAPSDDGGEASVPAAAAPAREGEGEGASGLGPVGYDEDGRRGRIHVVETGDTLWDISEAYLGTPWVWPSVWTENEAIENPHLIHPGDRIWITAGEMRRVTAEEAERLLENEPSAEEAEPPAALEHADALPPGSGEPATTYRYSGIETTGFVSEERFRGSFSIVESRNGRRFLGDHDRVVIGQGKGTVEKGDRFEVYRPGDPVHDPESGKRLGWTTENLGWLEVTEVHPETASAVIRLSRGEIEVGDHLRERDEPDPEIVVGGRPDVEGQIVHVPGSKRTVGDGDLVYLDRGARDGLERGSPLEVFRARGEAVDRVRDERVGLPDAVVGKLLVVRADEASAAALITYAESELHAGDRFRGTEPAAWKAGAAR